MMYQTRSPYLLIVWMAMLGLVTSTRAHAAPRFHPLPRAAGSSSGLSITRPSVPHQPFTVAGESGAILGQQNGDFEAWIFPVKILKDFRITAVLADYPIPIELTPLAAQIRVTPAETVITYSHAAFTVRQHMFVPARGTGGTPVILFEIDSVRPMQLTFRFTPEMQRMWPASNFAVSGTEWVKDGGYYILHTDDPKLSGAVAMPGANPGTLAPFQERPQTWPVELKLDFDPKHDSGHMYPLLMALGNSSAELGARLNHLNDTVVALYSATQAYYEHFFDTRLTVETPDEPFNQAMRWAAIAIDQARARFHGETGLVAGYYGSGASARPGFGWFFGRDTLWSLYAVNGYGDFELSRAALEFLISRQRTDGKIMHEYSQAADLVDWSALPYFYAAADSTPLLLMAMEDYVNTSGDVAFLSKHWDSVKRAYAFTRAHDSDGDGIYENTEGTGWVESWPNGMPHQEVYLAALDQQSSRCMSHLAEIMQDSALAVSAKKAGEKIRQGIEQNYYDRKHESYAFSRNANGSLDETFTIYPSVAWWTGRLTLPNAGNMLRGWASHEISTDWGTRDLSDRTEFYDPISYHQGSVWPLFTGWVSLAEYRTGRALAGYAHLMQNADLTFAQDLGAVTELLSGEFFQPLGRSSSHQTWSSAMVLTPALRGLFGLDWDALHHTLRLAPNIPASWNQAKLRRVRLGEASFDLEYRRVGRQLVIQVISNHPQVLCLVQQTNVPVAECAQPASRTHELRLELPAVEVGLDHQLPAPGSRTSQLKVLDQRLSERQLELVLEAPGGTVHELALRRNGVSVKTIGAEVVDERLRVRFPSGAGYQTQTVTLTW